MICIVNALTTAIMKTALLIEANLFSRKSGFRILFWLVLFAVVFVIFIIVSGYFAASKPLTYLPDIHSSYLESYPSGVNQIELKNPWYFLNVDEYGRINVKTPEHDIIMSSLTYFSDYEGAGENWGIKNISVNLMNDSTVSISGKGSSDVLVNVILTVHKSLPKIDVNIRTHYSYNTIVRREALVAKFDVPLSEVYLKNRKIDVKPFDPEYWLQRQGVRFGSGIRSSLIYHTPNVSSLQLNAEKNLVFINLEYFLDHPYIKIPYQEDGGGKWIDLSAANYDAGSEREDYFSIYFGSLPKITPRLMMVPHGYLSGFVFTEHADSGNIRTHRAAYFGSEKITNINDAVGGFAGYKIPVTKSVFYADTTMPRPSGSSIRDDLDKPQFLDFLDQLNATGLYDICLHTPEGYSSNRETMTEAIKFMKNRFNTSTWIDHGMYPGKINRESFVCDGLDPKSEYYAADLWKQYNTRYFWNTADESMYTSPVSLKREISHLKFRSASNELWRRYLYQRKCNGMTVCGAVLRLFNGNSHKFESNSLQPFKGNSYPTPLYWQNMTRTLDFYSWITNYTEDYRLLSTDKADNQLKRTLTQINLLIANWGIFINHAYFVRNRKGYDTLVENKGELVVNPFFDKILKFMADKRNEGVLYLTTIRDLLDYWIQLEKVSFEYQPTGAIRVYNDNNKAINGLSLVVKCKAEAIRINDEIPTFKQVGEDAIVWFDIPAKSNVRLEVEK
jgi:hypothetical protein